MTKDKLNVYLRAMLGDWELVEKWWNSPNKAFSRETPNDMWYTYNDQLTVIAYVMEQFQ